MGGGGRRSHDSCFLKSLKSGISSCVQRVSISHGHMTPRSPESPILSPALGTSAHASIRTRRMTRSLFPRSRSTLLLGTALPRFCTALGGTAAGWTCGLLAPSSASCSALVSRRCCRVTATSTSCCARCGSWARPRTRGGRERGSFRTLAKSPWRGFKKNKALLVPTFPHTRELERSFLSAQAVCFGRQVIEKKP